MISSGYDSGATRFWRGLLWLAPIFLLTFKGWISWVVALTGLAALTVWVFKRQHLYGGETKRLSRSESMVVLMFAAPLTAVVWGQLARGQLYWPNWDAPLRLLLCAPLFLALSRGWLLRSGQSVAEGWLRLSFPLCLIWTLLDKPSWTKAWDVGEFQRIVTYFVDPLSFGSLCLLLSLLTAMSWVFRIGVGRTRPDTTQHPNGVGTAASFTNKNYLLQCVGLLGVVTGLYLSLRSGSRSGWLVLPIFFWVLGRYGLVPWLGLRASMGLGLGLLAGVALAFWLNGSVLDKFLTGVREVQTYQWDGMNPDHSMSMRVSIWRMGVHYVMERPWSGWGDLGWLEHVRHAGFDAFASSEAMFVAPTRGFHNEILTSSVRSGLLGGLTALMFFTIPMVMARRAMRLANSPQLRMLGVVLMIWVAHQFLVALGTEINHLIYLASFNGLCLAVFLGEIFWQSRLQTTACAALSDQSVALSDQVVRQDGNG